MEEQGTTKHQACPPASYTEQILPGLPRGKHLTRASELQLVTLCGEVPCLDGPVPAEPASWVHLGDRPHRPPSNRTKGLVLLLNRLLMTPTLGPCRYGLHTNSQRPPPLRLLPLLGILGSDLPAPRPLKCTHRRWQTSGFPAHAASPRLCLLTGTPRARLQAVSSTNPSL